MIKLWSELPVARTRELLADVATLLWVVFWGNLVLQLFWSLIGFAGVGRAVHEGGENMIQGGQSLGASLAGLPVVGSQARDLASSAFAAGGQPMERGEPDASGPRGVPVLRSSIDPLGAGPGLGSAYRTVGRLLRANPTR